MSSGTLSFTLVGTERDSEAVTLKDFSSFLDHFAACLRRVEERTTGKAALRHLIDDLRVGSATMTVRPVSPSDAPDLGLEVYGTFRETIHALESGGQIDPRLTNDDLKAFRELAAPIWNRQKKVEVAGVELTTRYVSNIDAMLKGESKSKGTVKGRIEKLNVHQTHEFTLFPPIGSYAVRCIFPDELFDTVYEAVRRTITVTGTLYFKRDNPYPERVQVEAIEIHPDDSDLPTGTSLRGLLPDALGGKSAVDFIQAIRDER